MWVLTMVIGCILLVVIGCILLVVIGCVLVLDACCDTINPYCYFVMTHTIKMYHVSCIMYHVSCIMYHVSCSKFTEIFICIQIFYKMNLLLQMYVDPWF